MTPTLSHAEVVAALRQVIETAEVATQGPWEVRYFLGEPGWPIVVKMGVGPISDVHQAAMSPENASLIALAPLLAPTIQGHIETLERHLPVSAHDFAYCRYCERVHPCPDYRSALRAAETVAEYLKGTK